MFYQALEELHAQIPSSIIIVKASPNSRETQIINTKDYFDLLLFFLTLVTRRSDKLLVHLSLPCGHVISF